MPDENKSASRVALYGGPNSQMRVEIGNKVFHLAPNDVYVPRRLVAVLAEVCRLKQRGSIAENEAKEMYEMLVAYANTFGRRFPDRDPPSLPMVWRGFSLLLDHKTRDKVFAPAYDELMEDYTVDRRYSTGLWSRGWMRFAFGVRTAKTFFTCLLYTFWEQLLLLVSLVAIWKYIR